MARKQTRRSISVKGLTYQRLKNHCDANGTAISAFVEELVMDRLDELGVPVETILKPRPAQQPKVPPVITSQHFTF